MLSRLEKAFKNLKCRLAKLVLPVHMVKFFEPVS
jgi:hypothetical protein